MGLPEILIEFKTKAETAVKRSGNGIVALILRDDTKSGDGNLSYKYQTATDYGLTSSWSTTNRRYLNLAFAGLPKNVLVERIGADETYDDALARLRGKKWNYLAIPVIAEDDVQTIADWIIAQRSAKKSFKAVLPNCSANHEGIINFTTEGIKCGTYSYSTAEFCVRIAGLLAGLPMTESATYQVLADVTSITESLTADEDINSGKFILVNDGEKIKVGRGVNSLATLSGDKTEDMKKIKIIEGMDMMRDDIRATFENNYIGINNSYDNKVMFVAAINQYFDGLARLGVLYGEAENIADIDVTAQRDWLAQKYDVSEYSDDQIRKAKTGSFVFVKANVTFCDAIEDMSFSINME